MIRRPGWRSRLSAAINRHRPHPFAWGVHDCGILAGDAVLAMTGVDPIADLRGRYDTEAGLIRRLLELGYRGSADFLAAHFEEIPPGRASWGDLVMLETEGLGVIGICNGGTIAAYGQGGVGFNVPLVEAKRAFRV